MRISTNCRLWNLLFTAMIVGIIPLSVVNGELAIIRPPSSIIELGLSPADGSQVIELTLTNKGPDDALLNLGQTIAGWKYFSTAIQLQATDDQGHEHTLQFMGGPPAVAGRVDPFVVPLPVNAKYALRLELSQYVQEDFSSLRKGTWILQASYEGKQAKWGNSMTEGMNVFHCWSGKIKSPRIKISIP